MSIFPSPRPLLSLAMLLVLTTQLSSCGEIASRMAAQKYLKATIIPGVGLGDLHIRKTSLQEVIDKVGQHHERKAHGGYTPEDCEIIDCPINGTEASTIELHYKAEGLSFFFDKEPGQNIPEADLKLDRLQIECIQKKCPFQGKTEQGIQLNDTRQQVQEAYGAPNRTYTTSWLMSYPEGISFLIHNPYNDPVKGTDRVEGITIPDRV